jgi:iron-sulfur cluster assembly protein
MAIEITDTAVEEVRRMMAKEQVNAAGLRVGVKGGGCSGLSYNLSFESLNTYRRQSL